CFFYQAEDGIRDFHVTGVQTCALPIWDGLEVLPKHEDPEGAYHPWHDQGLVRIRPSEVDDQDVERDKEQLARDHHREQNDVEDELPPEEPQACQGVADDR